MSKLIALIVAAMFSAVSVSALAAAHAGAQDKGKMEKTQKKGEDKKKAEPKKKGEGKKKSEGKKSDKMDKMDKMDKKK